MKQNELLVIEAFKSSGYLIVNKTLIKKIGLIPAIILGNYIDKYVYFKKYHPENEGWFFLTHEQIKEQLNLKEHSIVKNKQFLIEIGILKTDKKGIPAKEWLKIDFEVLASLITDNEVDNENDVLQGQDPQFSGGQGPTFSGGLYKENINKGKQNNINKDSENNKLFSSSISVAPKKGATVSDKNKEFLPIVNKLVDIITSKKRIKIDGYKKSSWANSVRQLCERDGVEIERIEKAINWYERHHMDDYVPVIESGKSLREKFIKLEAAIERSKTTRRTRSNTSSGYSDREPLTYKKPRIV